MTTNVTATNPTRRRARTAQPITDQQRFDAVFTGLVTAGVAYWFDLRGSTGVREDRYNDYIRVAELNRTDRWVGEHVGNVDSGCAYWDADGVLRGGRRPNGVPYLKLWFSFNHELPELAELLVQLFREQGIDAWWSGDPYDSVVVNLDGARSHASPTDARPAIGR